MQLCKPGTEGDGLVGPKEKSSLAFGTRNKGYIYVLEAVCEGRNEEESSE